MDTQRGEHRASERAARELNQARGAHPDDPGRRHSFRVKVPGSASIWHKHELRGHYQLRDLCIEGCALIGEPCGKPGERVELALHLAGSPTVWLSAEVRRSEPGCVALRFLRTPARVEDRIQDLVVDSYARDHDHGEHFSLIVEPRASVRQALVRSFDAIGERAVGIATPLDAVQLLLERGERIHTVFLGPQPTMTPTFELAEFVARHYPHVHRVLVGDARELAEAWLAEATGEADALLELPCDEGALRKLVHRIGMLPREEPS